MRENVQLVDEQGNVIGYEEKLKAHQLGLLHNAFSLMLVRQTSAGYEFLLQQRALDKYHSGGLWSNTCCSHPRSDEPIEDAVHRRVNEELGIKTLSPLQALPAFIYKVCLDNQLIEHEYDQIFVSHCSPNAIYPEPTEVMSYKWINQKTILQLANSCNTFRKPFDNHLQNLEVCKLSQHQLVHRNCVHLNIFPERSERKMVNIYLKYILLEI